MKILPPSTPCFRMGDDMKKHKTRAQCSEKQYQKQHN